MSNLAALGALATKGANGKAANGGCGDRIAKTTIDAINARNNSFARTRTLPKPIRTLAPTICN